jgi:cell division protein FtsI/penicillin-binding protein 2
MGSMKTYCDEVLRREVAESSNVVFMNLQYLGQEYHIAFNFSTKRNFSYRI